MQVGEQLECAVTIDVIAKSCLLGTHRHLRVRLYASLQSLNLRHFLANIPTIMPKTNSSVVIVARFLKANHYSQVLPLI